MPMLLDGPGQDSPFAGDIYHGLGTFNDSTNNPAHGYVKPSESLVQSDLAAVFRARVSRELIPSTHSLLRSNICQTLGKLDVEGVSE